MDDVPLTLKIAPDLDDAQVGSIADALRRHRIDGVIATNTTIARDKVQGIAHGNEQGGLSGAPVFEASTAVVRKLAAALAGELPIIAAGGVLEGNGARQARRRCSPGADLQRTHLPWPGAGAECVRATAS